MGEKDPDHIARPGIPEALDPNLGNGALWETNPNDFILKSVDPLHQLDNMLLDDETRQSIIDRWNGKDLPTLIENLPSDDESPAIEPDGESEITEPKGKSIITRNKVKKTMEVEWAEDTLTPETESVDQLSPPPLEINATPEVIEESKPEPIGKVGKRVRKVVRKAKEEANLAVEFTPSVEEPDSGDGQLSPFTIWLKGLRGSEYVHPYDDDYALEQMSAAARGGVSETFADLLASQGYKDKAMVMYMKLMEKYPEKSSFFAAKIEALK